MNSQPAAVGAECLDSFLPAVSSWFVRTFGAPTPVQRLGWPAIVAGKHTLLLAPTGSGKTLAAFLACLDGLWRTPADGQSVRVLYVSPLKALSYDIERNLEQPIAGIETEAIIRGDALRSLSVAVRTGDTSQSERQRIRRQPPDILITTPESLHLMLTSRAREVLRCVEHVIVDEIHAVCGNKRGAFLALLLERLEAVAPRSFNRIGLSATQRPLEEVARFLGGLQPAADGQTLEPRPVTIVDAGVRRGMDLLVEYPGRPGTGSVWPGIESRLRELIDTHRSTIVFANNRRVVERLTARLNEGIADRRDDPYADQGDEDAAVDSGPHYAQAHHGSLSQEVRRGTEDALKRGVLPAVVATASLELGIDLGAVDLVCQVESPGAVSRGLQRVGRAGHVVGRISRGRLLAKTMTDLIESAALARMMVHAEVEELRVPRSPLDVLTQQVIACVAVDRWRVEDLFALIRRAYPYRDLTPVAFEGVIQLATGRYRVSTLRDLRPRIVWDRVRNELSSLPGTLSLAVAGGGTIPDTGQYPLYLGDGGPRLGELDEEFVLERRIGETFVLGSSTWRIESIDPQRVVVSRAEGRSALAPFWRGEAAGRSPELGQAVGVLCRELRDRPRDSATEAWLQSEYFLDASAAKELLKAVHRQLRHSGALPDDRTIVVETFRDEAGELGLAILTPFGGKLHHGVKLVLLAILRNRLGIDFAGLHNDDGILIRLPRLDEAPLDLFDGIDGTAATNLMRQEIGASALFGLRFRQNAGRALLMPRPDPKKRAPLWLQRLRAKDLLQAVRRFDDFPIVIETFRECLEDDLGAPRLKAFFDDVASGKIRVATHQGETPSPWTLELLLEFRQKYLYEWDEPRGDGRPGGTAGHDCVSAIVDEDTYANWLNPEAIGIVDRSLRGSGKLPRTADEMAVWLQRFGDVSASDLSGPMEAFLAELEKQERARKIELEGVDEPIRWVLADEAGLYQDAFNQCGDEASERALGIIISRFVQSRALVGGDELARRYPIDPLVAGAHLDCLAESEGWVRLPAEDGEAGGFRWADARNIERVRRLSIAIRRREAVAAPPEAFAEFVLRRQFVHRDARLEGADAVGRVLNRLEGFAAPTELWESAILAARVANFRSSWLDRSLFDGGFVWRAATDRGGDLFNAFHVRGFEGAWPVDDDPTPQDAREKAVLELLQSGGARFVDEIAGALGLSPSAIRSALNSLVRAGEVSNDRFDPLRPGSDSIDPVRVEARSSSRRGARRVSPRRNGHTVGRWWAIATPANDASSDVCIRAWISVLLDRYGVLSRETAALDRWSPAWRAMLPHLDLAELRGELRRGYFVEGLSGIQYATNDAAAELARIAGGAPSAPTPVLISALDPANLYGIGAPFDIPLLEGGSVRLSRQPSTSLVLSRGRPVLIVEGNGRRLTGLGTASESELREAVGFLAMLASPSRRSIRVETYNNAAVLGSPAAPWLARAGFVRDLHGMAHYAGVVPAR